MTPLILLVIRLLMHPGDLRLDKLQLAAGDLQRQHDLTAGRFARGTFRACPLYLRRAVLNPATGERDKNGGGCRPRDEGSPDVAFASGAYTA